MGTRHFLAIALLFAGVAPASGPPTPESAAAAKATAQNNPLCAAITPFYWEIGDAPGTMVSGSEGVGPTGEPVTATTTMNIASASKWLYGMYVVQLRGSAAKLTAQDVNFLHMTSGYSNMGAGAPGTCPPSVSPDIDVCLTLINPSDGLPYDYQDPTTTGFFAYDAGHFENHASRYTALGDLDDTTLGRTISEELGAGVRVSYSQPILAGAANMTPAHYAAALRHVLSRSLPMYGALGTHQVCTQPSDVCTAFNSPFPYAWHYSIAHWVEDDPAYDDDGAFSAAGAQGFYAWIEASKTYYGVIGRVTPGSGGNGIQSVQCGQLIRRAWDTGIEQTTVVRTR
jgi:hypothetical protein